MTPLLPTPRIAGLLPAVCPRYMEKSPFADSYWLGVKDGDPRAYALYQRHYSFRIYKSGRRNRLIAGPGEKMVLLTFQTDALFVWRKFDDMRHEPGVNCAVFRNESRIQSSTLILEAMELAWDRWPGERLYTYVNAKKIKSSNPGYCFKKAGWRSCGLTKGGLTILEVRPKSVPLPVLDYRTLPQPRIVITTARGSVALLDETALGETLAAMMRAG